MGGIARILMLFLGNVFSSEALKFIAMKAIMFTLFVVILPIVLNNFLYDILDMALQRATNLMSDGGFSTTVQLTSFSAYLANLFRIPECLSVFFSALTMKFCMRLIPFIRI